MIKKAILVVGMILVKNLAYCQIDCKNFRIGKFQNIENGIVTCDIQRNDSIQIETYNEILIKTRINWIDSCSYKLRFLEGNDAFWATREKNAPTPDLIVRIIKVKKNSYLQEARFEGDTEFKYESRIIKIE